MKPALSQIDILVFVSIHPVLLQKINKKYKIFDFRIPIYLPDASPKKEFLKFNL